MQKHPQSLFGIRLRQARMRSGLAQDRLGALIGLDEGCSSARISRYETGVHAPPFEVAEKLARILRIPVSYLYCPDDVLADMLIEWSDLSPAERAELRKSLQTILKRRA